MASNNAIEIRDAFKLKHKYPSTTTRPETCHGRYEEWTATRNSPVQAVKLPPTYLTWKTWWKVLIRALANVMRALVPQYASGPSEDNSVCMLKMVAHYSIKFYGRKKVNMAASVRGTQTMSCSIIWRRCCCVWWIWEWAIDKGKHLLKEKQRTNDGEYLTESMIMDMKKDAFLSNNDRRVPQRVNDYGHEERCIPFKQMTGEYLTESTIMDMKKDAFLSNKW